MTSSTAREAAAEGGASSRDQWFARFVDDHGESAYRTAYRLLRDRGDAHDAVQDALARAFDRWSELREPAAARGWFFRILVHGCISRQRRRRVRERALAWIGLAPAARTPDPSVAIDVSERVMPHLMRLSVKQRTALILRYGEDRSIDDIASAMGIAPESVKTHLKRGLAELRARVGVGDKP